MFELRIITMSKRKYNQIKKNTNDPDVDLLFWDYPLSELDYLYDSLLDCYGDNGCRYMALIGNRLYELPNGYGME